MGGRPGPGVREDLRRPAERAAGAQAEVAAQELAVEQCLIRSLIDGVVTRLSARQGMYVEQPTPLGEVIDLSSLFVQVRVPSKYRGQVQEGAKATVRANWLGEQTFEGRLERLSQEADAQSGDTDAFVRVDNQMEMLQPALSASVVIELPEIPDTLVVPVAAVADPVAAAPAGGLVAHPAAGWADRIERTLDAVLGALLLLITVSLIWQIFGRYVIGRAPGWSEEVARMSIVWLTMIGAAACLRSGSHIAVTVLLNAVGPRLRLALLACRDTCITRAAVATGTWSCRTKSTAAVTRVLTSTAAMLFRAGRSPTPTARPCARPPPRRDRTGR